MNRFTKDVRTIVSYPTLGFSEFAIAMTQYLIGRHDRILDVKGSSERRSAFERNKAYLKLRREEDELNTLPNVLDRGFRR